MARYPEGMLRSIARLLACLVLLTVCGGGCTWSGSSGGGGHSCRDLDGDGLCDSDGGTIIVIDTAPPADPVVGDGPLGNASADPGLAGSSGSGASVQAPASPTAVSEPLLEPLPTDPWDLSAATITAGATGWHPVGRLEDTAYVGLAALVGPGVHDADVLRDVTEDLRNANPELLGLEASDGELVFDGIEWVGAVLAVSWRQAGGAAAVLGHLDLRQTFWFDELGRLQAVENRLLTAAG